MINKIIKKENIQWIVLFVCILVLELLFFRSFIFNDTLFGDDGDGLLNNMLTEHWFQVILGKEKWNDLIVFYPIQNTISYTDMSLGFVFPYLIFRFFGFNIYMANKISLMLIHVYGSVCLAYILKKKCKISNVWNLISIITFSLCGAYASLLNHSQMFAVSFIPCIILMVWQYIEHRDKKIRHIYILIAVTEIVMLFYTAFYPAYFFSVFCLIFLITYLILGVFKWKINIKNIYGYIRKHLWEYSLYLLYAIFLFVPFIMAYWPTMQKMGARDWNVVIQQSPSLKNLIDFSSNTLLYGKLITELNWKGNASFEGDVNFSIITVVLLLVLVWIYIRRFKDIKSEYNIQYSLVLTCFITTFVCVFSVINLGNISAWYIFYKILPGASALRAMARFFLVLHLPMAILIGYCGELIIPKRKYYQLASSIVLLLLLLGNLKYTYQGNWNISEENAFLSEIKDPPEKCDVIYIYRDDYIPENAPYFQMDAWNIANAKQKKTINGYSGNYPENWCFLSQSPANSIGEALSWSDKYNLKNVYFYNVTEGEWVEKDDVKIKYTAQMTEMNVINGVKEATKFILYEDGQLYGPYIKLPKGNYKVTIKGKGLKDISYDCCSSNGEKNHECNNNVQSDEQIVYEINLTEITEQIEFRVMNRNEHDVMVECVMIEIQ